MEPDEKTDETEGTPVETPAEGETAAA